MPSFRTTFLAVAAALVATVGADYYIDPNSVPLATRQTWCSDEKATCPLICSQTTTGTPLVNSCDPTALTYGCVCSNGLQPNVSEYSLTLPYYTCTEFGTQCVAACGADNACSSACRQDHPCGAQNPTTANVTSSSATSTGTASATTSAGQVYTGLAGSGSTSSSDSSFAPPAFDMARIYTTFGMLGAMCVGFMYVL